MDRKKKTNRRQPDKAALAPLNRHELYTLCAQSPDRDARVLAAIHDRKLPAILGEDFSGTAALSSAWLTLHERNRAVAVDHDAQTLALAQPDKRLKSFVADVNHVAEPSDLIAVLNFSIGEIYRRSELVTYLTHARKRLKRGGCFVCDIYDGSDAFWTGPLDQLVKGPRGERITYFWEQRAAEPLTGRVVNAMHFHVKPGKGQKNYRLDDAYVYDWRLWRVTELRDAMMEAGFRSTQVYARTPDAIDDEGRYHMEPLTSSYELGDSFSVYVVGRTAVSNR